VLTSDTQNDKIVLSEQNSVTLDNKIGLSEQNSVTLDNKIGLPEWNYATPKWKLENQSNYHFQTCPTKTNLVYIKTL